MQTWEKYFKKSTRYDGAKKSKFAVYKVEEYVSG